MRPNYEFMVTNPETGITTPLTRVRSLSMTNRLQLGANNCSLSVERLHSNLTYQRLRVYRDSVLVWSGTVENQSDSDQIVKNSSLQALDRMHLFNNRVVAEKYLPTDDRQGRPDLIIKHLMMRYASEFTTGNVRVCNSVLDELDFPFVPLMEVSRRILSLLDDWHLYVDPSDDVHFFQSFESQGVSFASLGGAYNFDIRSLRVDSMDAQLVNRIWIVGIKRAAPGFIEQYYTADGQQRYFSLAYEPNYTEVYVDNLLKPSKVEVNDDGEQAFLINKKQRVVYIPNYVDPAWAGALRIRYRPTVQIIDYHENQAHIAKYGLIERVVKNRDITDRLSARQFARAELRRRTTPKRIVSLRTREWVKVGQRCLLDIYVDDPEVGKWDVRGQFLVSEVTTQADPSVEVHNVVLEEIV
jgi:hypothetical protein